MEIRQVRRRVRPSCRLGVSRTESRREPRCLPWIARPVALCRRLSPGRGRAREMVPYPKMKGEMGLRSSADSGHRTCSGMAGERVFTGHNLPQAADAGVQRSDHWAIRLVRGISSLRAIPFHSVPSDESDSQGDTAAGVLRLSSEASSQPRIPDDSSTPVRSLAQLPLESSRARFSEIMTFSGPAAGLARKTVVRCGRELFGRPMRPCQSGDRSRSEVPSASGISPDRSNWRSAALSTISRQL
jgi:hypothetical protein